MRFKRTISTILLLCMLFTLAACGSDKNEKVDFKETTEDTSDKIKTFAWESTPDISMYESMETFADILSNKYEGIHTEVLAQEGWVVEHKSENVRKPYTYTLKVSKNDEVKLFHYIMNLKENGLLEWCGTYDENGTLLTMEELNERTENLF